MTSDQKSWLETTDLPKVVLDLSKLQVLDGIVVDHSNHRLNIPVSASGSQYAKRSRLGGQRLYLTQDSGKFWLCFPFSNLHARFIYNADTDYHTRMNFYRMKHNEPNNEYISPSKSLKLLFENSDFPFSLEVFDTETGKKRRYSKEDFLSDMLRGPAANLASDVSLNCPSYLRPFTTALGVDAFALDAPPSATSENLVFSLNRPWNVWVNSTNFTGVTLFMPATGINTLGMPEYGLNRGETRKGTCNYAATREQIVDTKRLFLVDIEQEGFYDANSDEKLASNGPAFHDILVPYVSEGDCYAETISSNVFVIIERNNQKILITPKAEAGNYPGITRFFVLTFAETVLKPLGIIGDIMEYPLESDILKNKKVLEVFRTGSAAGINFVNGVIWFDRLKNRYFKRSFGNNAGKVTSLISEAFESVARGYEVSLKNPDKRVNLEALRRFSEMCVRLEVPEQKIESALPTFYPDSVKSYDRKLVLEGIGKTTRMFERISTVAKCHATNELRQLARSRY